MDVRNCPRCGNIFQKLRRDICPACAQNEDKEYEIVRDFIYDNPKSDVITVSEETGISVDTIMKFLRENRLVNLCDSLILECDGCGEPIPSGKYCGDCTEKLKKEISGIVPNKQESPAEKKSNASFHFMKDRLYKKR